MKVVIPRTVCREKIYFFWVPEANFGDMSKLFELSYNLDMLSKWQKLLRHLMGFTIAILSKALAKIIIFKQNFPWKVHKNSSFSSNFCKDMQSQMVSNDAILFVTSKACRGCNSSQIVCSYHQNSLRGLKKSKFFPYRPFLE